MVKASPTTLSERLIFARGRSGLSQEEVAQRVGMAQPSYSELERGVSKRTTKIGSLAACLLVDALWLETGQGSMERTGVHENLAIYMPNEQRKLIEAFDALPAAKRKALLTLLDR